jgi:hypothetical protein
MTATREAPVISIVRLVEALELLWAMIREQHPEVPAVILIPGASGSSNGTVQKWGHFWAERWELRDGSRVPEVVITGESFGREPVEILGTLLHEAAHAIARVRDVKDTSRAGRYHNARFKAIAEGLGLSIEHSAPIGFSVTSVPEATAARYEVGVKALADAVEAKRIAEPGRGRRAKAGAGDEGAGEGGRDTKNGIVVVCERGMCGGDKPRQFRIHVSVLELGGIVCQPCDAPFVPKDY